MFDFELKDLFSSTSSPQERIYELLKESQKESIVIRPSSIVEFFDNSLSWAIKQILGVSFPSSPESLIGSAVHYAADLGYKKFKSGEGFQFEDGLKAIELYVQENWKFVDPDSETSQEEVILEANRLFKAYYDLLVHNEPKVLLTEERFEYNFGQGIFLAGTVDRIDVGEDGDIAVDVKTSKQNVYGEKAEEPEELVALKQDLKSIKDQIKGLRIKAPSHLLNPTLLNRIVKKLQSLQKTLETSIKELQSQLKDAKRSFKNGEIEADTIASIEEGIKKRKSSLSNLKKRLKNREALLEKLPSYLALREKERELMEKIAPLQEEVNRQQYINDCEAVKKKYGLQLAAYALLYEISTGRKVSRGKIELIIRQKEVKVRVFEFDIEDLKVKVDSAIGQILKVLKAFRDGVDPEILFRLNPYTFRGQEVTKLLEEAEKSALGEKEVEEIAN